MIKKSRKALLAAGAAVAMMAAAPAQAGYVIIWYLEYVGGTQVAYEIRCSNGAVVASYGDPWSTGFFDYYEYDTSSYGC